MRTRLSACARKARFLTAAEAIEAARTATIPLRHYRCDRCRRFHLTSRTKGKRIPRPLASENDRGIGLRIGTLSSNGAPSHS